MPRPGRRRIQIALSRSVSGPSDERLALPLDDRDDSVIGRGRQPPIQADLLGAHRRAMGGVGKIKKAEI